MRSFIRQPTDIPLEYTVGEISPFRKVNMTNVGHGGLSFRSESCFEEGTAINIRIPLREPAFEAVGTIVWCRKRGDHFDVGVEFTDTRTENAVRMVEQVAYIEHYKRTVRDREGREISGEQAAFEWIAKFARHFPN